MHTHTHTYREYEARIAELKEQFGKEQADKTQLQSELDKLQKEWNDQLAQAQVYTVHVMIVAGEPLVKLEM